MPVTEIMSESVVTSLPQRSPEKALSLIRQRKITNLIVVDDDKKFLGIVSAYDVIKKLDDIKTIEEIMLPREPFLNRNCNCKRCNCHDGRSAFRHYSRLIDARQSVLGVVTRGSLLSAMSSQWTETEETQ